MRYMGSLLSAVWPAETDWLRHRRRAPDADFRRSAHAPAKYASGHIQVSHSPTSSRRKREERKNALPEGREPLPPAVTRPPDQLSGKNDGGETCRCTQL